LDVATDDFQMLHGIFGFLQLMIFECFHFNVLWLMFCDGAVLLFEMLQYIIFDIAAHNF
jgi:hypothetical protein